jgi:serine/threonine protein kinase/DNA-binding SARP family transcriptional activator
MAMAQLALYLLGLPRVELDGVPVQMERRKALALLIYLALSPQAQSRDVLATLFWPDYDQAYARANLRRSLSSLNGTLGKNWLEVEREHIALPSKDELWIDVSHFHRLLISCATHGHPTHEVCPACLISLSEAVTLYRDDFLTGFTLPDSPNFDDWRLFQAEALRQELAEALERLVQGHAGQGEYKSALAYARRRLALDPLHEPAHRHLMQLYAQADQQAAAMRQYQVCLETLETELGVSPAAETTALYEQIRTGKIKPAELLVPASVSITISAVLISHRYEIPDLEANLIGQGSMGRVYRGRDIQTNEPVAIKLLKPEYVATDPTMVERFAREGETLRQLNHPNIVKLLAAVEEGGHHYLVIEYVGGGSMRDLLKQQAPLPLSRVLQIALELSDALTQTHHRQIIHRDLKPGNVLLDAAGNPRLTDFGIAYLPNRPRLTETGLVLGTVDYLSPEACNGEKLDARTDIWAFGVLLYEMLSGEPPFRGDNLAATMAAILTRPTPDLAVLRPDLPAALVRLINQMLEKERNQRIASVRLVGAALEAIAQGDDLPTPDLRQPGAARFPAPNPEVPPELVVGLSPSTSIRLPPRHNLPTQTTSFIGREAELADIRRLLLDEPGCRLLNLVGPGGTGKTRLSLAAAGQTLDAFPDGAYFVSLAPVSETK